MCRGAHRHVAIIPRVAAFGDSAPALRTSSILLSAPFFWSELIRADFRLAGHSLQARADSVTSVSGREGGIRTRDLSVPNRVTGGCFVNDFSILSERGSHRVALFLGSPSRLDRA